MSGFCRYDCTDAVVQVSSVILSFASDCNWLSSRHVANVLIVLSHLPVPRGAATPEAGRGAEKMAGQRGFSSAELQVGFGTQSQKGAAHDMSC